MVGAVSDTASNATCAVSTTAVCVTDGCFTNGSAMTGVRVLGALNVTSTGNTSGGGGGVAGTVIGISQRSFGVGGCMTWWRDNGINNKPPASRCSATAVLIARTREVSMPRGREETCDCVRTIIHLQNGTAERTSAARTHYTIR